MVRVKEIYVLPRWFKVIEEGPSEQLSGESSSTDVTNLMNNGDINTQQDVEAPSVIRPINKRDRIIHSDLSDLNGKVDIDDDNAPDPENILSSADVLRILIQVPQQYKRIIQRFKHQIKLKYFKKSFKYINPQLN